MSDTKTLIKYVRDCIKDGPNIAFDNPTVCDLVEALEASEHRADKLKSDIDAGAKDYSALMDKHDAQFMRAEQAEAENVELREDLETSDKSLKEYEGFFANLCAGLKNRFQKQYENISDSEYGEDAFSADDIFEHVIDPAIQEAEANVARLTKERNWLADKLSDHCLADGGDCNITICPTYIACRNATPKVWIEAARRAVADAESSEKAPCPACKGKGGAEYEPGLLSYVCEVCGGTGQIEGRAVAAGGEPCQK